MSYTEDYAEEIDERTLELLWEKYIDVLSLTTSEELIYEEEMDLLATESFEFYLDKYIDKHFYAKSLPKERSLRLKEIVDYLKEIAIEEQNIEWKHSLIGLSNCLNAISESKKNSYYISELHDIFGLENKVSKIFRYVDINDIDDYPEYDDVMDTIMYLIHTRKICELELLNGAIYDSDEEYYNMAMKEYLKSPMYTEAINTLLIEHPGLLDDKKIATRILDILYLKNQLNEKNKIFATNTKISLNRNGTIYSYICGREHVIASRQSKEKTLVKSLYNVLKKEA